MTYTPARSILTVALFGAFAASTYAQFPGGGDRGGRGGDRGGFGGDRGGFGGGGRGGMSGGGPDPEMIWNMMSQGKDSINLNDPANARTKERMMSQGQPLPPNGILTKNDFKVSFERRMAERAAGGGRGGMMGAPGGMTGAPQTMTMTPGPNGQMMMSTNGGPPVPVTGNPAMMGSPGSSSRGGFDPTGMTDDQVKQMMAGRYELDPAGRISMAAAMNSSRGGGIKDSFQQYDTNRDGFIDANEYRGYLLARMNGGNGMSSMSGGMNGFPPPSGGPPSWGGPGGFPGGMPGGGPDRGRRAEEEEAKPVVYRYGNLPKEVPSWFEQQDTDKDGQIGLYEWRSAKKSLADFEEYDLNSDGYVTAEEWLRKQRVDLAKREEEERMSKPAGSTMQGGGRGDRNSFGSFGGGGRGGPGGGSPGGSDRSASSGRNPFTGAGGPPSGGDRGGRGGPGGGGDRGPGGRGGRGETSEVQTSKETKKERKESKGGSQE